MSNTTQQEDLKSEVREFWNQQPCGTQFADSERYTRAYFDEIEAYRYSVEPEIFSFAQFTRHHGEKVLEVGVGAGTDFVQWVRAGAEAYGIDATPEGVNHLLNRLEIFDLNAAEVRVADCEKLPYEDESFDLVYSWGVIHHTPDTPEALRQIVRVCRPGGKGKVMIYHRHSLLSFFFWVRWGLLKGRPWKSFAWCLWHHMESIGTKAYTRGEAFEMLRGQPVTDVRIGTRLTHYDRMGRQGKLLQMIARAAAHVFGDRFGWFLTIEFTRLPR
jgi:ubiquinone/menaquinone biosynthesis C-methylase UbiE